MGSQRKVTAFYQQAFAIRNARELKTNRFWFWFGKGSLHLSITEITVEVHEKVWVIDVHVLI